MRWYLRFIEILHYEETLVYLFTGKFTNGTTNILKAIQYESWFQNIRGNFI